MPDGTVKGNVDADLVLHTTIEFSNYDKAIIVSNDGDFRSLIEYLYKQNKLYRVLVPNKHYSRLLMLFNNYIVRLDLLEEKLSYYNKKKAKISGQSKP